MSDYLIDFPEDEVIDILFDDVIVTGTEPPSGTISITENGDYDVTEYAEASINVPQGITPTGTISITENGTVDVTTYAEASVNVPQGVFPSGTLAINENGSYDVTNYAGASVNVPPVYIKELYIEQGTIDNRSGGNTSSTTRIRTHSFLPIQWVNEIINKLTLPDSIYYVVRLYDSSDSFIGNVDPSTVTSNYQADISAYVSESDPWIKNREVQVYTNLENPTATQCRLVFRKSNNTSITPNDIKDYTFSIGANKFVCGI